MTISNGYATLAELKARLGITDTADDTPLEQVIEAVSRWIDEYCGRRFWRNSSDETRYYTGQNTDVLILDDDLISVTTLKTDDDGDRVYETTWASTDYDLEPYNAQIETPAKPYSMLRITPQGTQSFPSTRKGVQIVGKFGYAATTPLNVHEACLVQAGRVFRRKDAPFGVVGSAEFGTQAVIASLDPDVKTLLAPFQKLIMMAV